ncbi:hypothetical protein AKJ47_01985 [candidate division MSBL1 archaeon SCGC-AAA261G05]|uniref:Class I SAM-dependent methyltransferase n=1 Tax=candidate division MSBL1 archaeon SCGC-AAA261G05 TaxID=1698276 RepID=A0A133VAU9_9EURY|nr:hypothetical protein AKJ47_01985 [candidate division MSBL1 archaeon SCGC-AAA261G05]
MTNDFIGRIRTALEEGGVLKLAKRGFSRVLNLGIRVYNALVVFVTGGKKYSYSSSDSPELLEVKQRSEKRTDISDHLIPLFIESLEVDPDVIVELGVRGGESTFVFERVARLCGSVLISVDVEDCSDVSSYDRWHFVQMDDVEFVKVFDEWCTERQIEPNIDVLFVDTSHLYDHTLQEIRHWFPYLSDGSKAFFHDTNLTNFYLRRDFTIGRGWDNNRGVIRALEDCLDKKFDEKKEFIEFVGGWLIKHDPYCNGFTELVKIRETSKMRRNFSGDN